MPTETALAGKSSEQRFAHFLVQDSGVPKRQWEMKDRRGEEWNAAYCSLGTNLKTGFFSALIGMRGTGKTQIGVELIRYTIERYLLPAKYISAMEFFMEIKSTYRKDSEDDERDVINAYRKPSLLVIDEFGKRGDTEWANNLMFEMLNKRYGDKKDTLLIDNNTKEEFTRIIGPSLASRMQETGGIIECNWKSFRV